MSKEPIPDYVSLRRSISSSNKMLEIIVSDVKNHLRELFTAIYNDKEKLLINSSYLSDILNVIEKLDNTSSTVAALSSTLKQKMMHYMDHEVFARYVFTSHLGRNITKNLRSHHKVLGISENIDPEEISKLSESQLLKTPYIGRKALNKIKIALHGVGLEQTGS